MPGNGPAPAAGAKRNTLIGVVGVATAAIVAPFVAGWESGGIPRLVAYQGKHDPANIWTICNGETLGVKPGMVETVEGCLARDEAALVRHAEPVLACTPALRGHPNQLSAAISLAYNIGTGAYCRSTVDRRFDTGDWRGACDAFLLWNKAGGKVVNGLDRRRRAERALCLKELPR